MSTLALIKTFITALEGTVYEPWVDGVLFVSFLALILLAVVRLIFQKENLAAAKATFVLFKKAYDGLDNSIQYAPGAEKVRKKIYPYLELVSSILYALIALLYGGIVGIVTVWLQSKLPWYQILEGLSFFAACIIFMRFNLASATWAWHSIKTGQELTRRSSGTSEKPPAP